MSLANLTNNMTALSLTLENPSLKSCILLCPTPDEIARQFGVSLGSLGLIENQMMFLFPIFVCQIRENYVS